MTEATPALRRLRILYHHRTASRDGQAVHIDEMVGNLRALGHEVLVVGPALGAAEADVAPGAMGAKVGWVHRAKRIAPAALYELAELAYNAVAYPRLARAVRRFRPDVIYERYNLYQLAGAMARRRLRVPLLLEVNSPLAEERRAHGSLRLAGLARWAEGAAWRHADCVLPVTRVLAGHVEARGVPPARIVVNSNGVDVDHFTRVPAPDAAKAALGLAGRLVVGFTGFVRDWHRVDRVLEWLARPGPGAGAHLLLVGDGPARAELEALATRLGVRDRFTCTGAVDRVRIPALVAAFDIALQPAVVPYASPLKLFEYLAAGKPVVAPRTPNLEEVVTGDESVLFFAPDDREGLVRALDRLASDPALRDRLAAGARAVIVERRLAWRDIARRVEGVAARLAGASASSSVAPAGCPAPGGPGAARGSARPALVVFSPLFPSSVDAVRGVFVKERMFRVGRQLPITVVSPQPWFPLQSLVRIARPHFRVPLPRRETMDGVEILRPRFLSIPAVAKRFDAASMAVASAGTVAALARAGRADVLDAHWGFPGGAAAARIGRWLGIPVTITLRGDEARRCEQPAFRARITEALRGAARVFAVSGALRDLAVSLGVPAERTEVIGNGVDVDRFTPIDKAEARRRLGLPADVPVLVSVGTLCERKGFHRVIEALPALRLRHPGLLLVVVGGAGAEGDWSARLATLVRERGVADAVRFLGAMPPDELRVPLSAADVFVLATRYEGWANVLLEAMACGLPVVTTDVGGNAEVVRTPALGTIVPFGDAAALAAALDDALARHRDGGWDRAAIRRYAADNAWPRRIERLVSAFTAIDGARREAPLAETATEARHA
jgi:glycosyltransferase involved in cell wall biosynthesis